MGMAREAYMELELLPPLRTATTCGVIRLLLVMELGMVLDMDMARGASMELELLPPLRTATTCGVIRLLLVMESISLSLAVAPLSPSLSSTLELLPLKLELPPLMELVMVWDMDME